MTIAANAYAPAAPVNHYAPVKVTEDTYLIRQVFGEGTPQGVYVNSAVILGREPVIVDTGTVSNRKDWVEDVFSLVDPKDVRWIFISHDDHDHTGNLTLAMEMCPNATLVTNWFQMERLAGDLSIPPTRMRWVEDGEAFDAGDRLLVAIRPPVFDAPTTRGLYDSRSRVYWGGDSFASGLVTGTENVEELDPEFWAATFSTLNLAISPWIGFADQAKFERTVDRIAELDLRAIMGGHTAVVSGKQIDEALKLMRTLPSQPPAQLPTQADLDAIIAMLVG
jgi:flavorubredoxin